MPLNESKGNMYDFVTHTYNTVKRGWINSMLNIGRSWKRKDL